MPELDPFDVQLGIAVRSFADRARTDVDAMAVATRAIRRRRGIVDWLGRTVPVPVSVIVLVALLLVPLAWSWRSSLPSNGGIGLTPTPVPTPSPTPGLTPTPGPTHSANVSGTAQLVVESAGASELVGDETQIRGIVITVSNAVDDPRASGSGTFHLSVDATGSLGFEWGTFRLENAAGAWEGACSGASWNDGNASDVACWLTGSGAYEGLTYYWHGTNAGLAGNVVGTIVPAPVPSP